MSSPLIITITTKLKPFLVKVIPYDILSILKKKYLQKDITKMVKYPKEPCEFPIENKGVNFFANIKAQSGLGESARIVVSDLERARIPYTIYNCSIPGQGDEEDTEFDEKITNTCPYGVNIIHINPNEMATVLKTVGYSVLNKKYNIGFWSWELEDFPDEWQGCIEVLDEIWTPSEFTSNSIRKKTNKPVYTIPHFVSPRTEEKYNREYFGLPNDKYLCLVMYNSGSVSERKNPKAAIETYKIAFKDCLDEVGFVIKVGHATEQDMKELQNVLIDVPNVFFIYENLPRVEINSLIKCCDIYISLHRAEGFGLVLAEAMCLGTPVVATGWSGNMEFMNEGVAAIVKYSMVHPDVIQGGFSKESLWADADINDAAEKVLLLYKNKEYYKNIQNNAQKYIQEKLNPQFISNMVSSHFERIVGKKGD